MTATAQDLIWILDKDPSCLDLYQQTLGLQYQVRVFNEMDQFTEAVVKTSDSVPSLVLADPENNKGSLAEFYRRTRESLSHIQLPEFMIVTKNDDLELMRFYLKTGARDYILKPIRPNELVAKVEKALLQISNREILILRNDLDGIHVNDLTFREHQLLTIFLSRKERSVGRDELYGAIWSKVTVNRKTLDVHLFNLRRKLRPLGYDIFCRDQVFHLCRQGQQENTSAKQG